MREKMCIYRKYFLWSFYWSWDMFYSATNKLIKLARILVLKRNFFKSLQVFFVCLSRKTLGRLFIHLGYCFYSCKPQVRTKQIGLNIRFRIRQKNSGAAFKKSKTNMMVVQMLLFLLLHARSLHSGKTVCAFCITGL